MVKPGVNTALKLKYKIFEKQINHQGGGSQRLILPQKLQQNPNLLSLSNEERKQVRYAYCTQKLFTSDVVHFHFIGQCHKIALAFSTCVDKDEFDAGFGTFQMVLLFFK
jgi:hypothetical protein